MSGEGRCQHHRHFDFVLGKIEIKCKSRFCGKAPGIVIIHVFDPATGQLLETKKFRDPRVNKED